MAGRSAGWLVCTRIKKRAGEQEPRHTAPLLGRARAAVRKKERTLQSGLGFAYCIIQVTYTRPAQHFANIGGDRRQREGRPSLKGERRLVFLHTHSRGHGITTFWHCTREEGRERERERVCVCVCMFASDRRAAVIASQDEEDRGGKCRGPGSIGCAASSRIRRIVSLIWCFCFCACERSRRGLCARFPKFATLPGASICSLPPIGHRKLLSLSLSI